MRKNPSSENNLLDVEDETDRQKRLARLFAAQSSATPGLLRTSSGVERKTHAILPTTDLLSRVKAFLPVMKQANEALDGTTSGGIEEVRDVDSDSYTSEDSDGMHGDGEDLPEQEPYIKMNLGLGVFESRPAKEESSQACGANGHQEGDPSTFSSSSHPGPQKKIRPNQQGPSGRCISDGSRKPVN